jgi:hypothetical protein
MRHWQAPEKADILVSELLGSFGDNELSPECLDGAQGFLKEDGISIPCSYTSFLQPITTSKLWNDVKVCSWPGRTSPAGGGGPGIGFGCGKSMLPDQMQLPSARARGSCHLRPCDMCQVCVE